MPQCYVTTCGNYYEKTRKSKDIIYHMLPGDTTLAVQWVRACGKKHSKSPYYARVCSDHFSEQCYQRDLQHELLGLPLRRKLKPDAVPDQNLPIHVRRKIKDNIIAIKTEKISENKDASKDNSCTNINLISNNTAAISVIQQKQEILNIPKAQPKPTIPPFEPTRPSSKTIIIDSSPEISEIEILAQNAAAIHPKSHRSSTKIFDFKSPETNFESEILKEKECKDRSSKINNKLNRLPMRSSFRIAKKKSIESLSDSFTEKINSQSQSTGKPEKFTDKLKFMAKLQLKFERKENLVALPRYDLEASLDKMIRRECFANRYDVF